MSLRTPDAIFAVQIKCLCVLPFLEAAKVNITTMPPTHYARNTTVPTNSTKDNSFQTLEIIFICIGIILLLVTMAIGVGWLASRNKKIDYDEINERNNEDSIL